MAKCTDHTHERVQSSSPSTSPARTICLTCRRQKARDRYRDTRNIQLEWPCLTCGGLTGWTLKENGNTTGGQKRKYCTECAPYLKFYTTCANFQISKFMWDAMYFEQEGQCAMASCSREAYAVDHDHACCPIKGKSCGRCVRGLLCSRCNNGLSFIEDSMWVQAAHEYLDYNEYWSSGRACLTPEEQAEDLINKMFPAKKAAVR